LARKTLALRSVLIFFTLALSALAFAEGTRTWEQSKFDELIKGTAKGIALRSEGGLELAPAFKALATTPSTYIWSIASDAAGNIYAAAGSPARVYRITPDGKSTAIFEAQELQVQSLVVAKNGNVYAATAPDGKVYRLAQKTAPASDKSSKGAAITRSANSSTDDGWSNSVYFDPGAKYIWDLALDEAGNLYVATGDHGEISKVTASGQHSLFFKSDEVHIRVLALDSKGNLIAGSDGSGLVYRITPSSEAFVLYSAPKKEITALAIDSAGNIYAAASGEKRPGSSSSGLPNISITPAQTAPGSAPAGGANVASATAPAAPAMPFPAPGLGATGGSEIFRIAPDGAPAHLWSSRDDLVYALGFDQRGRLLAGTGNRGHIYAINGVDDYTDLVKAGATQITAFAAAPGGGLYASTSNLGKVFVLGSGLEPEGSFESDVFDAHGFSSWGRARVRSAGNVELYARSGNVDNPDRNWSPWTRVDLAGSAETKVPPARFVQWKSVLHGETGVPARRADHAEKVSPHLDSVLLNYLPKNVAPEVDEITVQPGYHYQPIPHVTGTEPPAPGQPRFDPPPPAVRDRDSIGIRWLAHDDNDDQLTYSIYYRGDGESRWLLLKDGLPDRYHSFESSLLPDGGYTVMVVASDAPSHSPGEALVAQKISARFEVDNTAPTIDNLNAAMDGKQIHVRFRASDSFSVIKHAEYSVDGGDWQFVEPVGALSDAKTEDYDFRAAVPQAQMTPPPMTEPVGGDHVVVVRAYDRFDNLATAKVVVRGK
jgi:ligand-binding sensor domain-containing protein